MYTYIYTQFIHTHISIYTLRREGPDLDEEVNGVPHRQVVGGVERLAEEGEQGVAWFDGLLMVSFVSGVLMCVWVGGRHDSSSVDLHPTKPNQTKPNTEKYG